MSLNKVALVHAAHRLLTRYGLHDVSMRRLAAELDVAPGALYYHVPNKQALLALVARHVTEPLAGHQGDAIQLMEEFRDTALTLKDGGDLFLIAYAEDPALVPVPQLCQRLIDSGFSAVEAPVRADLVMRYALGAITTEQNRELLGHTAHDGEESSRYRAGLGLLLRGG